jgi:hypothetical protein
MVVNFHPVSPGALSNFNTMSKRFSPPSKGERVGDGVEGEGVGSSVMIVGAGVGFSVVDTALEPAGATVQKTVLSTIVVIPLPLQLKLAGGLLLSEQTCSLIQSY